MKEDHEHERVNDEIRKRKFAKALTRAVFGRHYWDEKLDAELKSDRKRKSTA